MLLQLSGCRQAVVLPGQAGGGLLSAKAKMATAVFAIRLLYATLFLLFFATESSEWA